MKRTAQKSVFINIFFLLVVLVSNLSTPAHAQFMDSDVPEIVLEAYSTGFYRPLILMHPATTDSLPSISEESARDFNKRLKYALIWSGYVDLKEVSTSGISEEFMPRNPMELKNWFTIQGSSVYAYVRLAEPGEDEAFYQGKIAINAENAKQNAEVAAEELLEKLTGMIPPFRSRIVCVEPVGNNQKELIMLSYDGGKRWPLTRDQSIALSPSWSPDGRKIAFCSFRGGKDADLYVADLDKRKILPLVQREGTDAAPAWSPDGKHILFAGSKGSRTDIFLVTADGKNKRNLTSSPYIDTSPSWAPTGRDIVFMSDRGGSPQIYRMDIDGANLLRLTYDGSYNADPSWSPIGDRIVYARLESNGFQLRSMTPAGDSDIPLTNESGDHLEPAWTPDGMKISYTHSGKIWVMNADGTGKFELLAGGNMADWSK